VSLESRNLTKLGASPFFYFAKEDTTSVRTDSDLLIWQASFNLCP